MDDFVWVLAAPDGRCVPWEGRGRERYSATTPQRVACSVYVRRRIADGDLRVCPAPEDKDKMGKESK